VLFLSWKRIRLVLGLTLCLSSVAHAQTFTAELKKIDTLRRTFGDQVVNSLTNLPPDQYKAARDQALALAVKAGDNEFARDDAKAQLCAQYAKLGAVCHDVVETAEDEPAPADVSAVSGVSKTADSSQPQSDTDPTLAAESAPAQPQAGADPTLAAEAPSPTANEVAASEAAVKQSESDPDEEGAPKLESGDEKNAPSASVASGEAEPTLSQFEAKPGDDPQLDDTGDASGDKAAQQQPAAKPQATPKRRLSSDTSSSHRDPVL
jgi:hypothetical protein